MKTIILVGGGHSHLHCLKKLKQSRDENVKWILISPSRHQYYSGMFSGYTEGIYSLEETRIDLHTLCEKSGCDFVESTVLSIDPDQQHLLTDNGDIFTYDFVSFDIGSRNDSLDIQGLHDHNLPIKPNYRFPDQIEKLHRSRNTIFIGGGAASVEMALSLKAWKVDHGFDDHDITVVHSSPLLEKAGPFSSKKMHGVAHSKGLTLQEGRVTKVDGTHVHTDKGESLPCDEVIFLGGPKAPPLFGSSILPTDDHGFLLVNSYLQSVDYPNVFGAGDCATLKDFPDLPKNGVTAVRQGPVLWKNLRGAAAAGSIIPFEPQKRYLAIMSIGQKQGFLTYGSFSLVSGWAWKLKNWIDVRFIKKYEE
ncbi:NAD(P)/FAD-dependent oxidoreductase [Bacillus sp. KH172YL63]|uniref:NAD(P)/FAD-dependent oxidoreductase n=1 Tax=Bacillus sp. KH172YL63 TaxID=2709784 RepID=UPI0013E440D3|nr:FAD-dependent oxidoreductase [Bacillus sp. KH172YL63]BCB02082.1 pyridine nucleotide-disulfide oxidoreductase [Bacillus sp. KH172YL63]